MGRETGLLGYSGQTRGCCDDWKAYFRPWHGGGLILRAMDNDGNPNRPSLINWPNSTLVSLRRPLVNGQCLEKIGAWFAYRLLNVIAIAVDIFSTLTALVLAIITIPWPEKHQFFRERAITSSVNAVAGLIELFTIELQAIGCCRPLTPGVR